VSHGQAPSTAATAAWRVDSGFVLPVVIFAILALVPLTTLGAADAYSLALTTRIMIFAVAAIALDLLVGYSALVSFGHAAFVGLGAYAVGILASHGVQDALISLPAALALAALFALATGAVCLRTRGVYFIMITLAFGQMAFFTASSLAPYGGDDGLTLAARNTIAAVPAFRSERVFYYFVFACLLGSYLLCRALVDSRFGRVLRGARENPTRMATLGFNVYRFQLTAYVIAGALGGLAGFLLANATEFVSPAYMSWQRSGELIIMVLLGGVGSLHGAVIGAAAYLLAEEWLSAVTEHWKVIFGPMLVLVVVFARGGLIGAAAELRRTVASVPIPKFALLCRTLWCELRNQRDTTSV
jgi:branched-chain amino acid transport system permease protein